MSKAKPKAKNTSTGTQPRKAATKSPPKAGTKAKPVAGKATAGRAGTKAKPVAGKAAAGKAPANKLKPSRVQKGDKVVLLSGGNPQIAKADGDAPVQAYIAAMPGWKSDVGKRLDALIMRAAPKVQKAVRWNSPFYGMEGQGWFLAFHVFTRYVKVTFIRGQSLRPLPPGPSKDKDARYLDIHETDEIDEAQFTSWVKQAAALPGWIP